ncbi:MAG: hydantoinase B/oxoprolinase family protein [Armatimonadota bacterium]|nr:hydantoinase B/oxoprolinase family protein [Armatimonadota bacterium]MDR7452807.1 hydantoinase B/oxoprolinase family protein [Armatimonadota bacterium]MDR7505844.1 hydantoinase B/oxoprolinase family protein [Armatimonadota bacterium]MDR7546222.1 hydantoinase B/oxoprolinase family protein [Armatimonadota bacterium]MDR7559296.1 hydantoinase B/oxoprolinase family protein [Armatimonadota bacterium]
MTAFDPVSLEIMWSRLINITEECWVTIWRTAFSTIIGEAQDFGCELLDAGANSIAHSPRSMPVFNLTLPRAVRALLEFFPGPTLEDGDVLVTNDPWVCAGHLFDLAVVTPVHRRGRLVGLVGSIAHCSDIGGTKDSWRAREVYEEGLQIPPLKLYRGGALNDDLAALIRSNVRNPEMVFGDIQAQVGANRVGAERLLAFMDEYRLDTLEPLAREVQDRAEAAMRRAIALVPDGTYHGEVELDAAGTRLRLGCDVIVRGDELTVDWVEVPPELPMGGVNCTYSYAAAHTVYALKSILTPEIPSNAGCFRPLHVRAPEGSVLNARHPAAVNQRTMVGWFCGPAIFRALAPMLPDRVQAFTGLPASGTAYGRDARGRTFNDHIMFGGGQGASRHGDGHAALMYPTSAGNVPVEMFEQRTPLLVERKELIPDSGGPGLHRGGLGQRLILRKVAPGPPVLVNILPHGMGAPVAGLLGGLPGGPARFTAKGRTVRNGRGTTTLVELRDPGDVIVVESSGGSGFSDPRRRSVAAIARDLAEGYVTPAGLRAYGAAASPSGEVVRRRTGRTGGRGRTRSGARRISSQRSRRRMRRP